MAQIQINLFGNVLRGYSTFFIQLRFKVHILVGCQCMCSKSGQTEGIAIDMFGPFLVESCHPDSCR